MKGSSGGSCDVAHPATLRAQRPSMKGSSGGSCDFTSANHNKIHAVGPQ